MTWLTMAIAGIMRPETKIKNAVELMSTNQMGTGTKFVVTMIGTKLKIAKAQKVRSLP